ncbi:hypothetical protein M0R45_000805 [Rubus argutus]|uniref:Secreted protein n=1 Tax=Rubus argutus TaxID=59490 RepID=A0AAW1VP55_RUBAR
MREGTLSFSCFLLFLSRLRLHFESASPAIHNKQSHTHPPVMASHLATVNHNHNQETFTLFLFSLRPTPLTSAMLTTTPLGVQISSTHRAQLTPAPLHRSFLRSFLKPRCRREAHAQSFSGRNTASTQPSLWFFTRAGNHQQPS